MKPQKLTKTSFYLSIWSLFKTAYLKNNLTYECLLKFTKSTLALLMFIVFQSCSKDADLISEYVIRDVEKIEFSTKLSHYDFIEIATPVNVQEHKLSRPTNRFGVQDSK